MWNWKDHVGDYDVPGWANDKISSIYLDSGYYAILYQDVGRGGWQWLVTGSVPEFPAMYNDQVSSVQFQEGQVQLPQAPMTGIGNYGNATLPYGTYTHSQLHDPGVRVYTSHSYKVIEVRENVRVVLHNLDNMKGEHLIINGYSTNLDLCNIPFLGDGENWGWKTYSITVTWPSNWYRKRSCSLIRPMDIGCGRNGITYAIGPTDTDWGGRIFKKIGSNDYQRIHGLATRIDVDSDGNPWVINKEGLIFEGDGRGGWVSLPRFPGRIKAIDVGCSINDYNNSGINKGVYFIGEYGNVWFKWRTTWANISGMSNAERIDVDSYGNLWVVAGNNVYRYRNGAWENTSFPFNVSEISDLGIGGDSDNEDVYVVAKDNATGRFRLYRYHQKWIDCGQEISPYNVHGVSVTTGPFQNPPNPWIAVDDCITYYQIY